MYSLQLQAQVNFSGRKHYCCGNFNHICLQRISTYAGTSIRELSNTRHDGQKLKVKVKLELKLKLNGIEGITLIHIRPIRVEWMSNRQPYPNTNMKQNQICGVFHHSRLVSALHRLRLHAIDESMSVSFEWGDR